jgi:membrane protein implicated in regulation of membrane protease activity
VLAALLVGFDVWLCAYHWADMVGNLEAQFVIITPAFVVQHVLFKRHVDARHDETTERLDAQDETLAEQRQQVGELHRFHVRGELPERELRPWLHDEPPTT